MLFLPTSLPSPLPYSLAGLFDGGELRVICPQRPQGRCLMEQNLLKTILEVR